MSDLGNWSTVRYGPLHDQFLAYNTDAAGSNLPAIVYFPGGGWSRTHPRAFYDDTVGELVWRDGTDGLYANIGSYPVKAFSVNYALHRSDYAAANDNDPHDRVIDQYTVTPRYGSSGGRDAQRAVAFLKANADAYGIDVRKIIVMGASAGGPVAQVVGYGAPRAFLSDPDPAGGGPNIVRSRSNVAGVHLHISPVDWRDYQNAGAHGTKLYGLPSGDADWNALEDARIGATSGVQLIEQYGPKPTWLWYPSAAPNEPAESPPFHVPATAWAISTAYSVGDRRNNSPTTHYYCYTAHTSTAADEPPTTVGGGDGGANWQDYWYVGQISPYHASVCGRILRDAILAAGGSVVFANNDTGHSYPLDAVDWMKTVWNRI